jgi:iron(III) transport system substrate-binding protein
LAALTAAAMLAACGGKDPAPSEGASAVEQAINYSGADREAHLYECAKKEGKLVYYTSSSAVKKLIKPAFEAKYPGVPVDVFEATTDLVQRLVEEENAGRHNFDIYGDIHNNLDRTDKYFAKFSTPASNGLQPQLNNPYFVGVNGFIMGAAYNPTLVTDPPKTYQDLADPKWKGKVYGAIDTTTPITFGVVKKKYGEDFLKTLSQNVRVQEGASSRGVADLVISGEAPIGWGISSSYEKSDHINKKAPFQWFPLAPMVATYSTYSISKAAPHPCAGALAVDWLLSAEGQKIWAEQGNASPFANQPVLPFDIPGTDPKTWEIVYGTDPAIIQGFPSYREAASEWGDEFRNIFIRK